MVSAQAPTPFSTHDHTTTAVTTTTTLFEGWADVKAPGSAPPGVASGDGRIYSVGTVRVLTTASADNPRYSGASINAPSSWPDFSGPATGTGRQVVVLQCSEPDGTIAWQNFFYGDSSLPTLPSIFQRGANARAVSVWRGATAADTRIAICGESHDAELPESGQAPWSLIDGLIGPTGMLASGMPSGFIAVYDGSGNLLWSYEFRYDAHHGQCAITDVSIRVEGSGASARDVVTYCGISSFGNPGDVGESLTPLRPFDGSTYANPAGGFTPADGDTNNGPGQWDGIVGRLSNDHSSPVPANTTREFHSIVGGRHQDGLWGLAELDADRFVVVGGSADVGAGAGTPAFPFTLTQFGPWDTASDFCVGVVMVFEVPEGANDPLNLQKSTSIGQVAFGEHTQARDVMVHFDNRPSGGFDAHDIVLVGTTDDDALFGSLLVAAPAPVPTMPYAGSRDGFLLVGRDDAPGLFQFYEGTFQGIDAESSFTGVAGWSEYVDHVGVLGTVQGDLWLGSYWSDDATASLPLLVRSRRVLTTPAEIPASMGDHLATVASGFTPDSGLDYDEFQLGAPVGGGISVDDRGRFHVVGAVLGAGNPAIGANARAYRGGTDALRSAYDLLPANVGRSDRTGELVHNGVSIPAPQPGTTGATTPTGALTAFGRRPYEPLPSGGLARMFIDWEGAAPAATSNPSGPAEHFILVDRPPLDTQLAVSVIQFGVPVAPAGPDPVLQIENWVPSGVTQSLYVAPGANSLRIPLILPAATPGTVTFSVQVATLSLGSFNCPGCTAYAASPAIVFSY